MKPNKECVDLSKGRPSASGLLFPATAFVFMTLVGCVQERPSRIVKMVEQAGAQDVHAASVQSLAQWFYRHPDVAVTAEKMCRTIRASASVRWPQTTEGRVCEAAQEIGGFLEWRQQLEHDRDHRTFGATWK